MVELIVIKLLKYSNRQDQYEENNYLVEWKF